MWQNWEKTKISNREIIYSYLLELKGAGTEIVIELTAMLIQSSDVSTDWKALITAFHPSSGEYIDYEDIFHSFDEAEKMAWRKAQESISIRRSNH